jgi:hypothetical protein
MIPPDGSVRSGNVQVFDVSDVPYEPSFVERIGERVVDLARNNFSAAKRFIDDDQTQNTTGSAKYGKSGLPLKASANAAKAQLNAQEMENELKWMNDPTKEVDIAAGPGDDLWFEQAQADDEVSVSMFSARTELLNVGDDITILKLVKDKQDEKAKMKALEEESGKNIVLKKSTKKAQLNAKQMGSMIEELKSSYVGSDLNLEGDDDLDPESLKNDIAWLKANSRSYVPPSDKSFDKNKKKAMKVQKALGRVSKAGVGKGVLKAEETARKLREAVEAFQKQGNQYIEDVKDFEYDQGTFKKLNDLFGQWELKGLPPQKWEKFDPRDNVEDALRRAKDLQGCLGLLLGGHFDPKDPHYNSAALNRIKDILVDWKFKQDNDASEMEEALKWWRLNAGSFDPLNATEEDDEMFRRAKGLLALFGLKEGDELDSRNKEMQEALKFWAQHKNSSWDELDENVVEKLKKVKHALLQLKRETLDAEEMQHMAVEMNDIMSWYMLEGFKVKDLKLASRSDVSKFKKVQGFLSLWGNRYNPSIEQLKQIADSLVVFRRIN